MKWRHAAAMLWSCCAALALGGGGAARAEAVVARDAQLQRATELRADKLPMAPVIAALPAGARAELLSLEGGWALVTVDGGKASGPARTGWVRAGTLSLPMASAEAASVANGRMAPHGVVLSLGVRGLPARSHRHALLIGVGRQATDRLPPLPGVRVDAESATQIALALQVPPDRIATLQDEQATADGIRLALGELAGRVGEGDRVFVYFSGRGTRAADAGSVGCGPALLAFDGEGAGAIPLAEFAALLAPIARKTDKLFVLLDAGFDGAGAASAAGGIHGISGSSGIDANDEGALGSRHASASASCAPPAEGRADPALYAEQLGRGASARDLVYLAGAAGGVTALDDALKGGLATQFTRDCMLRDARDLDGSGAITMDELRQCAQRKIDARLRGDARWLPQRLALSGNEAFVTRWSGPPSATAQAAQAAAVAPTAASAAAVEMTPTPLTGAQALRQLFEQRDAKRRVQVRLDSASLRIREDVLGLGLSADRPGHVYVAMAGSDDRSLQLLFPNDLDQDNRIAAGETMRLPRAQWRVRAAGPPGTDTLLVIVADAPRDLSALSAGGPLSKSGPFVSSLNDAAGRAQWGALLTSSRAAAAQECAEASARRGDPLCSDAYGAALVTVEERP